MAKIALLIGVSEYLPEFPALPSAVKDVEAMKEVLGNPEMGGFDSKNITVLKNSSCQQIREAIYELFADRNKEDVLLLYFSGHGVKSKQGNLFLATPETRKSQRGIVTPTAVGASVLQNEMNNSFSERLVVILDCCYSGAFTKGMTAKGDENIDIEAELGGKGRAILMSSSAVQSSFESEGSELSIYTKYIVEGIKTGAADTDNNGKISADELHQYLSEKVRQESPAMTPQFEPVQEGYRIYLASSPQDDPKLQYRLKVQEILQKNNGKIDLLNGFLLEELSNRYSLSSEDAKAIETEEMKPYIQFHKKLKRYEEIFSQAVENSYPFTEKQREILQEIQSLLGLRDEDIAAIEEGLLPQSSESKSETFSTAKAVETSPQNDEDVGTIEEQVIPKSLESETFSTAKAIETSPQNNEDARTIEKPIIPQEQHLQNDTQSNPTVEKSSPLPRGAENKKFKFNNNFVAGIIGVGVLGIGFFVGVPYISNLLTSTPETTINSEYSTLENLLKEKKWKEADQKTSRLMLKVAEREERGYLIERDIENFSCTDLRTIDQLWVKYSDGKFGFSVQKKIYQSLGGTKEYNREVWEKFGEKVGWKRGKGKWLSYNELTWTRWLWTHDTGHQPASMAGTTLWPSPYAWPSYLIARPFFSRAETCRL